MNEQSMSVVELQRLVQKLEEAIYDTDVELSVNQLSDVDTAQFRSLPNQLWLSLNSGDLMTAILDAEELKNKAERFAYVVDNQDVVKKANHLFNEIMFASEKVS